MNVLRHGVPQLAMNSAVAAMYTGAKTGISFHLHPTGSFSGSGWLEDAGAGQ